MTDSKSPSPNSNDPQPTNPVMATPGTMRNDPLNPSNPPPLGLTKAEKEEEKRDARTAADVVKAAEELQRRRDREDEPWWKKLKLPVSFRRYRGAGPQLVLTRGGEVKAYSGDFIVTAGGFEFVLTTEQVMELFPFVKIDDLPEEEPETDPIKRRARLERDIANLTAKAAEVDTELEVRLQNEKLEKQKKDLEEARSKGRILRTEESVAERLERERKELAAARAANEKK